MIAAFGIGDLPAVNATLNAVSAILVVAAVVAIKRRREVVHRRLMLTAVVVSTAFLVCYIVYHGFSESKPFKAQGWVRPAYFAMLISHVVLAAAVVPLVLVTVVRGLKDQRDRHRRIARWTVPIWLYVSVTGVLVYLSVHVWQ